MDHQPSSLKFAVIGHQDSWRKISQFVNSQRSANRPELSETSIREIYKYFPPGRLFDVQVCSPLCGAIHGFYIETFIPPDELHPAFLWQNIRKVKAACEKAALLGADIVSLGGFTSIVLESAKDGLGYINNTAFTTGNTLTAALIAEAVGKAVADSGRSLDECTLLVIGSTGDIGSACTRYFSRRVKKLLLNARRAGPLQRQESDLRKSGTDCHSSTVGGDLIPQADIVICAASSLMPPDLTEGLRDNAIVCDAGYPKNIQAHRARKKQRFFSGGMGVMKYPCQFTPHHFQDTLYSFPVNNVLHGCILESMVLAMERQAVPWSTGRGNISEASMTHMLHMANRHEITTSPFFNG